jgi:hypothetical protein
MTFALVFPPTDIVVRDYLLHATSTGEERDCKGYLRSLLRSLFTSARLQTERLLAAGKLVTYACLAKTFYDFFKDVSQREGSIEVIANAVVKNITSTDIWESFNMLEFGLKECCSDWLVKSSCSIPISIDEMHLLYVLLHVEDVGSADTLCSHSKSVLSEGVEEDLPS